MKDDRVPLVLRTSDRSGVSGLKNLAMVNTHVQWEAEKAGKPGRCWTISLREPDTAGGMPLFVENLMKHGHLHAGDATRQLNSPPWKCLNWKTPYQALAEELLHLIWHAADSR